MESNNPLRPEKRSRHLTNEEFDNESDFQREKRKARNWAINEAHDNLKKYKYTDNEIYDMLNSDRADVVDKSQLNLRKEIIQLDPEK